jgi:hypothetical protein
MGQTTIEWTASPRSDGTWASGYTKRIENLRRFCRGPTGGCPATFGSGQPVKIKSASTSAIRFSARRKPGYISSAMSRRSGRYL